MAGGREERQGLLPPFRRSALPPIWTPAPPDHRFSCGRCERPTVRVKGPRPTRSCRLQSDLLPARLTADLGRYSGRKVPHVDAAPGASEP